jgi:hypothetical protein
MRISLAMIDLAAPYIENIRIENNDKKSLSVKYVVGGVIYMF